MTLVFAWVLVPLLFYALAFGCGSLLERITGIRLPGALVPPAGFAVVIVIASLTTMNARTAVLTTPLVVALAVVGVGLEFPFDRRPDMLAAGTAAAVFLVYAAPIVLSGSATFAGYISLDDTATWLAFADNALMHGRSLAGVAPSTYWAVLHDNLPNGYPIGSMVPFGIAHQLTRQDTAWLFQPYVAFVCSLLSLSIYALVQPLIGSRPLRALVAFLGAQPALLFGYAFWSGIKEVTVAYLVALAAALAASELKQKWSLIGQLPLAVAAAALLVCLSVLGAVWLVGLVLFVVLLAAACGARRAARSLGIATVAGLALALPALVNASAFVRSANGSDSGHGALGNLFHPLSALQTLGIWPVADFRGRPSSMTFTYVLLVVLAVTAVYGIWRAVKEKTWGLAIYALVAVCGWVTVLLFDKLGHGSPWLDAKAFASASPALLVAGLAGSALLVSSKYRIGLATLALLAFGVLWSDVLAYGNVWLAPRGQLAELETIGKQFAGDGPTLMTEYQPYGVRHFLREMAAEGASERRVRPVSLRSGGVLDKTQYADLDAFDLNSVLFYRTLVLRTSPLESRPPSSYAPLWSGRWYEVWQRPLQPGVTIDRLPLGNVDDPEGVARCSDVLRLGDAAAGRGGMLVAAERPQPELVPLTGFQLPPSWQAGSDGTVLPGGAGTLTGTIAVPRGGRIGFWLGGSFRGRVRLRVDGELVGSARDQLEEAAQLTPLGFAVLRAGRHQVELRYEAGGWRPGSRGTPFRVGPLVAGRPATTTHLLRVSPAQAASLCGRPFDWIEAVAPA